MKKDKTFSQRWYALIIPITITVAVCMVFGYADAKSKTDSDKDLTDIELLGKYVFYDKISSPNRMACVTCHDPATGGTGSVSGVNLHQVAITGANPHTVGSVKPPSNAYASFVQPIHDCPFGGGRLCGGNFWNGRAIGDVAVTDEFPGATKHIGGEIFYTTDGELLPVEVDDFEVYFGPTADQALNPMPNPDEHNSDRISVCQHVASSKYAELYEGVWGVPIDCSDDEVMISASDVDESEKAYDISFKRLMLAVCAYQASPDVNSFSSKRDIALQRELDGIDVDWTPGKFPLVGLTDQENLGHDLYYGIVSDLNSEGKNAQCSNCHSDHPPIRFPPPVTPGDTGNELTQLYTENAFHNIGTPKNPEMPDTGNNPDLGLMGLTGNERHRGLHRTPTLRNVDKRKGEGFIKAYTHNGWFKSLESIVHYYNTAFLGGPISPFPGSPVIPYEETTAYTFGVTRCDEGIETEKDALANNCWPAPAVSGGIPMPFEFGDLDLTLEEEAAIVAYLKTLTDEHTTKAPHPYK